MSDSFFPHAVGFFKFLEVIDDEWRKDRLSDDEVRLPFPLTLFDFLKQHFKIRVRLMSPLQIILPKGHALPADDMDDPDGDVLDGGKEDEKWLDQGLDYIAN